MNETPETRLSLLHRVRDSQDRVAWEEFTAIYEPLIYRLARRSGLQDADAREVTQEALVAVAGAIDSWEPKSSRGSFRAWLFRLSRNLAINFLIKQQRHPRGSGETQMHQWLAEQPEADAGEEALFEEEYHRQLLRTAAAKVRDTFQEKTWMAFWRTCVDAEPISQVARDLEMKPGSVYAARSRVMAKLAEEAQRLQFLEE